MKKHAVKVLALLLSCLMAISLFVACGTKTTDSTPSGSTPSDSAPSDNEPSGFDPDDVSQGDATGKDTVTVALRTDSGALDPANLTTETFAAVNCIQETLWDVTENNEVVYILAKDVEIVSDTEWIIHLQEGVKFSNGSDFTASDILFSIQKHNEAGPFGAVRVSTIDPEASSVIDDYTFNMQLYAPSITNWTKCAQLSIYDEQTYDESTAGSNPIGTGPYVLVDYVPNSHLNLERRDDYWGELPDAKYLNFRILAENSQRVNALETGLVDYAFISTEDVDYAQSLTGFNVDTRYTGNYVLIGYNFGVNSFFYHNREARQAIAHAVDPQAIIDAVYLGRGKVMKAAVVDLNFDFEDRFNNMDSTYEIGYNPDLARELAENAGLAGQTITIITDGSAQSIKTAEIIKNMLNQIGVSLNINNYDAATVTTMIYDPEADYDLSVGAGISPNRRVGDQLLNGVIWSATLTAPGGFEGNEEYIQRVPETMSTTDPVALSEVLYELLGVYEREVIHFALCNNEQSNAYADFIDINSVRYSVGTGMPRFCDLAFVS